MTLKVPKKEVNEFDVSNLLVCNWIKYDANPVFTNKSHRGWGKTCYQMILGELKPQLIQNPG